MIQLTPISPPRTALSNVLRIDAPASALAALKRTASSIEDLTAWFREHPQLLLGDIVLDKNDTVKVTSTENSIDLYTFLPEQGLDVLLTIEVSRSSPTKSTLHKAFHVRSDGVEIKSTVWLTLSMKDWPLGCAAMAAKYVIVVSDLIKPAFSSIEQLLETYIPIHFPGFTLRKLQDIVNAGFLPTSERGQPYVADVVALLFGTYAISTGLDLPSDMA